MNQDLEHLKILSIFHYVLGGLAALFACIPVVHLLVGIGMVTGSFGPDADADQAIVIGWVFICLAITFIFFGWALALGLIFAGRFLSQRKHYTFCLVVAGIACLFMPFGTILGVFTIIVLVRDSVKKLFFPSGEPVQKAG